MSEATKEPTSAPSEESSAPAAVVGTAFDRARAMVEAGKPLDEVKKMLAAEGLDEESARILVNSLPGAKLPSTLPEPNVSLTTNALAPDLFSFGELGLSGDPATVGLYWIVFAAVFGVVVLLVMFLPLPQLFGDEGPSDAFLYFVEVILPPAGLGLAAVAFARGAYLFTKDRRFKLSRRAK